MANSGLLQKIEVDYTSTVDEKLPGIELLAKEGSLFDAIDQLLNLEKLTRSASDYHSTSRLLISIVKLCFEAKKWDLLIDNIYLLCKRRGQLTQAVQKMIQECVTYVDETPDKEMKIKYIETLRKVSDGKIYVETERARLTRTLASMMEEDGNVTEAAETLQELQVETYGSMDKREKVEFLLEQMRLCLLKKDYVRTHIISKKISEKFFEKKDTEELKLKYYDLMISLDSHDEAYLKVCRHCCHILTSPSITEDAEKRQSVLKAAILFVLLSPYDNEQADQSHRLLENPLLNEIPVYRELLQTFLRTEQMRWNHIVETFEKTLRKEAPGIDTFDSNTEEGRKRWEALRIRVVEHNIRMMSKYYTRVRMSRMAELLGLSEQEGEEFFSALVTKGSISAKIDRLDGIVSFATQPSPVQVLNDWSRDVSKLRSLVSEVTHLINKEEMVHRVGLTKV